MAITSTKIVRDYIDKISDLNRTIILSDTKYSELSQQKNVDIIRVNGDEDIIVAYADISITGTDRPKPQIRIFMDRIKEAYEFAKNNNMRFFLFSIFSKDKTMAKNIKNFDPHEYLVSIETNIDNDSSRRDIRSMYDFLDEYISKKGLVNYVRCSAGQHQSGVYQASFIRIMDGESVISQEFMNYITFFDSRPYMNSINRMPIESEKDIDNGLGNNRIIFGAPGTGKSHKLEDDRKVFGSHFERVTFHPNYSYAQFVGMYKPVMKKQDDKKEISYEYVPGPFMRVYLNAKRNILVNEEYKDISGTKVYYEPATDMESWNLFDEIKCIGDTEYFKATKDMKVGDVALIYIGNNNYGYEKGVYAIAKVISEPEIDASEDDESLWVNLRFDKISYDKPIISKEVFDQYNTQYQSVHRIENGEELLHDISFGAENELLLIEEINRANVAAVFGDVFQLLDRKNGISEYAIATSEDMRQYLDEELEGYNVDNSEMRIPSNMYIWATMNSADQGVFPMDTAFKRRWEFEYLSVDDEEQVAAIQDYVIPMCVDNTYYVNWQELRDGINTILKAEKINEDKLLGPFFISKAMLDDIQAIKENREKISSGEITEFEIIDATLKKEQDFIKAFESKVIMYLFEDVMKMRPGKIFIGHDNNQGNMIFSEICKAFEKDGEKIFDLQLKHIE